MSLTISLTGNAPTVVKSGNVAKNLINNSIFGWGVFPVEARVRKRLLEMIMFASTPPPNGEGQCLANKASRNVIIGWVLVTLQ